MSSVASEAVATHGDASKATIRTDCTELNADIEISA